MPPTIVAHRANGFGALENTLPAFRGLAQSGIAGVEFDVWLTQDRQPVVHHDADIAVGGRRLNIMKTPRHALPEAIPNLGDVLNLVRGLPFVNVEIKPMPHDLHRIMPYLKGDNVCVSSFRWPTLRELRRRSPAMRLGLLVPELYAIATVIDTAKALSCEALHLSLRQLRPSWCAAAAQAGIAVRVYTANRVLDWQRCMELGVDAIMTDRPLALRQWLNTTAIASSASV